MNNSKKAKSEETRCLAFGQTDVRRCRLERISGEKTCHIHRNYYRNWFKTHEPFYHIETLTERELAEYKFQLTNGHLLLPREHVETLPGIYKEYYIFLLEHTKLSPSVNRSLFRNILNRLFLKGYEEGFMNSTVFRARIDRCFKWALRDSLSCIYVFTAILDFVYSFALHVEIGGSQYTYATLETFLDVVLLQYPEWRQLTYSNILHDLCADRQAIHERSGYLPIYIEGITQTLKPILDTVLTLFQITHQSALIEHMRPHKEELIASACHPRHLQRWLDSGHTLDVLDQMGWD
jgi:hypothetical protein